MSSAFTKDTLRTIRGGIRRFLSIAAITTLGVTMLVGLKVACDDLRMSADAFYDAQHMYDVSVQSTLGLTADDVSALGDLDGVEAVAGSWGETAYTQVGDARASVSVSALVDGMNEPHVLEGRLPQTAGEVAVTREFLEDAGKKIGDEVAFDDGTAKDTGEGSNEDEADSGEVFRRQGYRIVGSVIDPTSINAKHGSSSFRSTGPKYSFFVTPQAAESDVYTVVYLRVEGAQGEDAFSSAYEERVAKVTSEAEAIRDERERARTEQVKADATSKVDESAQEADERFAEAEARLAEAQGKLDDGAREIADGRAELAEQGKAAREQLDAAQAQLDSGATQLAEGKAQLDASETQLAEGERQLAAGAAQLDEAEAQTSAQLADARRLAQDGYDQAAAGRDQAQAGADALAAQLGDVWPEAEWEAVAGAADESASAGAQESFRARLRGNLDAAIAQLEAKGAELQGTVSQLEGQITQMRPAAEQAKAALPGLREQASALEGAIAELETAIEQTKAGIAEVDAQIEALDPDAEGYEDLLAGLQASKASLEGRLAETTAAHNAQQKAYDEQVRPAIEQAEQAVAGLAKLEEGLAQARDGLTQVEQGKAGLTQVTDDTISQLASGMGQASVGLAQAQAGLAQVEDGERQAQDEFARQRATIAAQHTRLESGKAQLEAGRAQLEASRVELEGGRAELSRQRASAEAQLADGAAQLDDAEAELADGQAELDKSRAEYEREKADALAKLADARREVDELEAATWYVQDRSSISSFSSVDSDASSIETIGTVFPAIFLVVAILVSLTTATRMVEEQRGLIGLYKALGYSRGRILGKYVAFGLGASLLGGVVGTALGFVALPLFLFSVFEVMYTLPAFELHFEPWLFALSVGVFCLGITLAIILTCRGELRERPAMLMRPKAPKAGSRILLERVRPLWRRMSFLNKVTARNLFRYKRRFLMTVFGVMGCTALMICGFAINDTVLALSPNQYGDASREGVYDYDLLAVTQPADLTAAAASLTANGEVEGYVGVRMENVTLEHDGAKETVQLMVVPDGFSLGGYIRLVDESGAELDLARATEDGGMLVTKNAANVLGFQVGDELAMQDTSLRSATAKVDGIVMNYLGNNVYLTQGTYERLFGTKLEANALLAQLTGDADAQIALADSLASDPTYLSVTSTQRSIRDFESNFMLINYVVVLITAMAAGLAFVVLFTLSTTNISERERELATIKVLGFRRGEVRRYINRETMVLTLIGIALGIPAGTVLGHFLTVALNMPSMYFAVEIHPLSYVWSCALSLAFALVVNAITNRSLDRIDMVGALKSAE